MTETLPVPGLVPSLQVRVELAEPEDHGRTAAGHRRVVPIIGGSISGDFTGVILPGGADWQVVRDDGTIEIDSRYSARGDDGSLLYIRAIGLRTGPAEVLAALGSGEQVDPRSYYFRTTVWLESSSRPDLANRLFVAACARHRAEVVYTAYRVS
ncbi:DUF3237 domain-containing protein [Leifsonia shinshuensis]|uniref:DUF3237 domain-containing protein n=1 Tax=Leifsonia shinshuensis TaxID=150026 RepID=UPI001F508E66|nr:DUF3237 domain-containing protein [Leifsonia shinshuensis]MCI0159302.1 DUF3237 domain-containing protein [Leifsonia shinshuensis]